MSFSSDPGLLANQLPISNDIPKEWEKFQEFMELWIKRNTNAVNSKEGGLYSLSEIFSFKQYYTVNNPNVFRNVYRKSFDFVALHGGNIAVGAALSFPHSITGLKQSGLVYAQCTSVTPTYFSVMGPTLVCLDALNVNFTNSSGVVLSSVIVVAEYLKT
jgi:hypothetical protein